MATIYRWQLNWLWMCQSETEIFSQLTDRVTSDVFRIDADHWCAVRQGKDNPSYESSSGRVSLYEFAIIVCGMEQMVNSRGS